MSKEKQIEEMARDICECFNNDGTCYQDDKLCDCKCDSFTDAQYLYEKGYRKQSEGEWYVNHMMNRFPSKRGRTIHYETYTCSVCKKQNGRHKTNFCPNCGAKMKGGAE